LFNIIYFNKVQLSGVCLKLIKDQLWFYNNYNVA